MYVPLSASFSSDQYVRFSVIDYLVFVVLLEAAIRRQRTGGDGRARLNARSRTTLEVEAVRAQYADAFMFAGPTGARAADKAAVLASLPKGLAFLESLGHRSTTVALIDETRLDPHYVLARVQFLWRFEKPAQQPVAVEVHTTFILYAGGGAVAIVFQQERDDFPDLLRAAGLLPPKSE
jgi:hypothetical protein